ncbi:hypothetical protein LEMLEM_LOCUS4657, partial [Lemmus lemmus]
LCPRLSSPVHVPSAAARVTDTPCPFLLHSGLQSPHSPRPLPSLYRALGIRCSTREVCPVHVWGLQRQRQQVLL